MFIGLFAALYPIIKIVIVNGLDGLRRYEHGLWHSIFSRATIWAFEQFRQRYQWFYHCSFEFYLESLCWLNCVTKRKILLLLPHCCYHHYYQYCKCHYYIIIKTFHIFSKIKCIKTYLQTYTIKLSNFLNCSKIKYFMP